MPKASSIFGRAAPRTLPQPDTFNRAGAPAFTGSLRQDLLSVLTTNTLTGQFYIGEKALRDETLATIKRGVEEDPRFTAQAILYARNEGFMQLVPVVGLAILATGDDMARQYFRQIFPEVIRTPDNLREFVAACLSGTIRNRLSGQTVRKAIRRWFANLSEFHALKYGSSRSKDITLRDILRLVHPKPANPEQDRLFHYLINGIGDEVPPEDAPRELKLVWAYERFKRLPESLEALSLVGAYKLPWEIVVPAAKRMTKDLWYRLALNMPYMALLRHTATLAKAGVFDEGAGRLLLGRLQDRDLMQRAKVLPFRLYQANREIQADLEIPSYQKSLIKASLDIALEGAIDNIEPIEDVVVALDTSGSMSSESFGKSTTIKAREIGIMIAAIAQRRFKADVMEFNSAARWIRGWGNDTILSMMSSFRGTDGGTNMGTILPLLETSRRHPKVLIAITDNESWAGKGFRNELERYKQKHPSIVSYLINLTPYQEYSAPTNVKGIHHISGFSDNTLRFVAYAAKLGTDAQVRYVESLPLTAYSASTENRPDLDGQDPD